MMYVDTQRAPRTMKIVLATVSVVSLAYLTGVIVLVGMQTDTLDASAWIVIGGTALFLFFLFMLMNSSVLTVAMDDTGATFHLAPFHRKGRHVSWSEVTKIVIRPVNPFWEFGGWGIRWDLGNKMGYVWRGKKGAEFFLKNGKRIVCTLQDVEGARQFLSQLLTEGNTHIIIDDRELTKI